MTLYKTVIFVALCLGQQVSPGNDSVDARLVLRKRRRGIFQVWANLILIVEGGEAEVRWEVCIALIRSAIVQSRKRGAVVGCAPLRFGQTGVYPDVFGGIGRVKKVPLLTSVGEAGFVCQFRAVTVILAESGVPLAITLTVPPATIVPDHVLTLLLPLLETTLLLVSVNFHPLTWCRLARRL